MKRLYSLIYTNDRDFLYLIVMAESIFDAERIAEEDVKGWSGFHVYKANYLSRSSLDAGEVIFVGG